MQFKRVNVKTINRGNACFYQEEYSHFLLFVQGVSRNLTIIHKLKLMKFFRILSGKACRGSISKNTTLRL